MKHPLPLHVVLGSGGFRRTPEPPASADPTPAASVLGTSYFATPRLGSPLTSRSAGLRLNKDGRVLGEDRKGPFDQFRPKSLLLSTVRLTTINVTTTITTYFNDQLKEEQNNDALVEARRITPREADERNDEWERREWRRRLDALPEKIGRAALRFHAVTGLMRLYEIVLARYVLCVDCPAVAAAPTHGSERAAEVMDNLTRDTYRASLRTSQLLRVRECSPGTVLSAKGTATSASREHARAMFSTCLWANALPFVAELTVQQLVLAYGYGINYRARQKRMKKRQGGQGKEAEDGIDESAYVLSLVFQSSRLAIAKSMSWIAASAGGALGSVLYPGWGTVFGVQIGDTVVGALTE